MPEVYRSYVVRVRSRKDAPEAIRIDVEDLIGGRRNALTGAAARGLADGLAAVVAEAPDAGLGSPAPLAGSVDSAGDAHKGR